MTRHFISASRHSNRQGFQYNTLATQNALPVSLPNGGWAAPRNTAEAGRTPDLQHAYWNMHTPWQSEYFYEILLVCDCSKSDGVKKKKKPLLPPLIQQGTPGPLAAVVLLSYKLASDLLVAGRLQLHCKVEQRPTTQDLHRSVYLPLSDRTRNRTGSDTSSPPGRHRATMASLLPLISELLPMVMPAPAEVTRAKDLHPVHPTVEGPVLQRDAIMDKCDKMCASGEFMEMLNFPD